MPACDGLLPALPWHLCWSRASWSGKPSLSRRQREASAPGTTVWDGQSQGERHGPTQRSLKGTRPQWPYGAFIWCYFILFYSPKYYCLSFFPQHPQQLGVCQPPRGRRPPTRSVAVQKEVCTFGPDGRTKTVMLVDAAQQTGNTTVLLCNTELFFLWGYK